MTQDRDEAKTISAFETSPKQPLVPQGYVAPSLNEEDVTSSKLATLKTNTDEGDVDDKKANGAMTCKSESTKKTENNDDDDRVTGDDNEDKDEDDADEESSLRTANGVPVDHGWAWMVTLGTFLLFLICHSNHIMLSVLLLDLVDFYQTSLTLMNILMSLKSLAYSVACQFGVAVIIPRVSVRKLFVVSAFCNSMCTMINVFNTSMAVFIVVNCVKHATYGLMMMPALTLVGHYFKHRRALASSLSLLGLSMAQLLSPMLVTYLREHYGIQGCFLLVAGFELHAIVAASLLRPLSSYATAQADVESTDIGSVSAGQEAKQQSTTEGAACSSEKSILQNRANHSFSKVEKRSALDAGEPIDMDTHSLRPESPMARGHGQGHRQKSSSSQDVQVALLNGSGSSRTVNGLVPRHNNITADWLLSQSSDTIDKTRQRKPASTRIHNSQALDGKPDTGQPRSPSYKFLSWLSLNSTLTTSSLSIADVKQVTLQELKSVKKPTNSKTQVSKEGKNNINNNEEHIGHKNKYFALIRSIFNLSLLRSWSGRLYLASYVLARTVGFVGTFLAAYATQSGLDKTQAALLLVIHGAVDMVSRLLFGFIGDLRLTRPKNIIAFTTLCTGVICCLANLYRDFALLVFFAASTGFFGCVALSLKTNNVIDLYGVHMLGPVLSQSSLLLSLSSMVQFPILGVLIDETGELVCVFFYVAAGYFLSTCLIILMGFVTPSKPGDKTDDEGKEDLV